MSKLWEPQPIEIYQKWVDDIIAQAELNEWESQFVDDMATKLAKRWNLTKGQADKLEEIYAGKTK